MSTIGSTTFPLDGLKKYFTLYNEQYTRRLAIGPNWKILSVGLMYNVEATVSLVQTGIMIGIGTSADGLGVGPKQGAGSLSYFLGVGTGATGNIWGWDTGVFGNYDYNAGVGGSGSYFNAEYMFSGAVSGSTSGAQGGQGVNTYAPTHELPPRKAHTIQMILERTSATTVSVYGSGANSWVGVWDSYSQVDSALYSSLLSNKGNNGNVNGTAFYSGLTTRTLTGANDALYPLDTISVWARGGATFRIYNVAVARLK